MIGDRPDSPAHHPYGDAVSSPSFGPRSLLFVPGGRPDMVAKVPRSAPDAAVVDLEDAVAPGDKDAVRANLADNLAPLASPGPTTVLVRVNPPDSPWFADDVAAVAATPAAGVVLPKLERPGDADRLRRMLADRGRLDVVVVAGVETALGVAECRRLLGGVDAVYFGAEDYIADLGGRRTAESREVLYARSELVLAARLAGVAAIDQAVVAVHEDGRFVADAADGRAMGYAGKICLHPTQVRLAHEVFTPSADEVRRAHAIVDAARAGVGVVDGEMVDEAHVKMAAAVLRRSGEVEA